MAQTTADELLQPFGVDINLETGQMPGATSRLVRRASDMRGYYADPKALAALIAAGDPMHYEVFEVPVPQTYGQLMYCISKLQPGLVGQEYFMTKGHYHTVPQTAEVYLCLAGQGYMMMKTTDGKWDAQKMTRGRMVYVPPYWGHRSINTGTDPLVSFCVYPAEAGHNYGDIASEGFPKRIVQRQGRAVIE